MSLTKDIVTGALRNVPNPAGGDLVSSGAHKWTAACDNFASIRIEMPPETTSGVLDKLATEVREAIAQAAAGAGGSLAALTVEFVNDAGKVVHTNRFTPTPGAPAPAQQNAQPAGGHKPIGGLGTPAQDGAESLPGVKYIVAVGAGKGGVGKSTVAINLAVGLARKGHAVGLLDGDIYGPSVPTMLGLADQEPNIVGTMLQPFPAHGIKAMSIGKLVDEDKPLIWRGPMAHGAFKQLTEQTQWGELDYLIVDLPPGTGDVPLTLGQMLRTTGAVIVCTPQKVAQDDAVRAIRMFQQLGIDILGVVENMSYFIGDDGKEYDIFGRGGAEYMAQKMGIPFLGAIPITMALRENCDKGDASANFDPAKMGEPLTTSLDDFITNTEGQVSLAAMRQGTSIPTLNIS